MSLSKVLNKAAQTGVFDNAEKKALLKLASALEASETALETRVAAIEANGLIAADADVAAFSDTAGGISAALVAAGLMEVGG